MNALELRTGDADAFFETPFACYNGSHYVSPMRSDIRRMLDPARNPYLRDGHATLQAFTVHRAGRVAGRIAAHVHRTSNRVHGERRASFGFFDCEDDPEVARALLGAAESFGREQGCDQLLGNFNLTAAQQMGIMTGGFEHAPYTDMIYNPPHVPRLLEQCGYQPQFPMTTFELDLTSFDAGRMLGEREQQLARDPSITWGLLRRRQFRPLMSAARDILNASFARNPLFVPVSEAEFFFQAGELMWIVDERLSPVAWVHDRPACVIACIPDLNPFLRDIKSRAGWRTPWSFVRHRMRPDRAIILFGAVRPEWQSRGMATLGLYRTITALQSAGYRTAGITWVSDQNEPSLRLMRRLGARPLHRLHLFGRNLAA